MITQLDYNWRQYQDGTEAGEQYDRLTVGQRGVIKITEWKSVGDGDKWRYDVDFEDGTRRRIFNPNEVWIDNQITGGENS